MSSITQLMKENHTVVLNSYKDPLIDTWLFMDSPLPVLGIAIVYLYFVLELGPRFMENERPFELKSILIVYNAYQVLFSLWVCNNFFSIQGLLPYVTNCKVTNPENNQKLASAAWWYFFSKIIDLLDTIFFILRKKQNQVTFLHVYHHTITMLFSWGYLKYLPGEQGAVIGLLNSFVHVVMYFYYFVAALGPKYRRYIWWKKYMTWIQLIQFCAMLLYLSSTIVMDCQVPKELTFFFGTNVIIFLYLFGDFYRMAYKKQLVSEKIEKVTKVE